MKFQKEIPHNIEIDLSNEEIAKLSEQPCCDSLDLVDKILSTFTWHDQRSREGKLKIIAILDKHRNIIISQLGEELK